MTIQLTRKHYKRIRWYFQSPRGASSRADNIDLDLAALQLIMRSDLHQGIVCFQLTDAGVAELSAENQREIERRRPHHSLSSKLAEWLRAQGRVTWENIQFDVDIDSYGQLSRKSVRPDVFSVKATMNPAQIRPFVHEIKVSRADFLADIANPAKRGTYGLISEGLYYVAPEGIIMVDDCPEECGLIVESSGDFTVIKRHKRRPIQLGPRQFMNLILKPGAVNPL